MRTLLAFRRFCPQTWYVAPGLIVCCRNAENLPRTMPETETHAAQSCTPPPRLMLVAGIQYAHFVPRATVAVVVLPALALLRLRAAVAVGGVKGGVVEEAVRVVGVQGP